MKNSFLRKIIFPTRHPWITTAFYAPFIGLILAYILSIDSRGFIFYSRFILLGLVEWTFIEYLIHRFIFHPRRTERKIWLIASYHHLNHHRNMNDPTLTQSPLITSFSFGFLNYLIIKVGIGDSIRALLVLTGISLGYILYNWIHYAIHQYPMTNPIGKYLKRYHLLHHLKYPNQAYGVTSPFWDILFHTYKSQ